MKERLRTAAFCCLATGALMVVFLFFAFGASNRDPVWVWALIYLSYYGCIPALGLGAVLLVASVLWPRN